YSTYLGGSGFTAATGVAVDSYGDAFIAGWTETRDIPASGAAAQTNAGGVDAFVAKLAPAGNSLVYVTYLGGGLEDRAFGIAADTVGDVAITGVTYSTDWPVLGAAPARLKGYKNAFVARLNPSGNLVFSTCLGGSGSDSGNAVALDSFGNAYVAGVASSTNFPVLSPYQAANRGGQDAFVSKFSAAGALLYSTYLGGSGDDQANGIAVDAFGQAVVTGGSFSTNFPTAGALQPSNHGGEDAFVTRLISSGSALSFSTYLGGSGGTPVNQEQGTAVAIDTSANIYIAGVTSSTDFPVAAAAQSYGGGISDAFAAEIAYTGAALVYSTYLGGNDLDWATGIAVDSSNRAWIGGYTSSTGFPLVLPIQQQLKGDYD
ncbi:MAG: SBBP repeat-containing protein, partial [Bryobacteraceae bacterium]